MVTFQNRATASPRDILGPATNTVTWARQFPRPRGAENCHYPVSRCEPRAGLQAGVPKADFARFRLPRAPRWADRQVRAQRGAGASRHRYRALSGRSRGRGTGGVRRGGAGDALGWLRCAGGGEVRDSNPRSSTSHFRAINSNGTRTDLARPVPQFPVWLRSLARQPIDVDSTPITILIQGILA
jgi:hypothetical protein